MRKADKTSTLTSPTLKKEKIIAEDYDRKDGRTNCVQSIDSYFNNSSMMKPESIESESDTFSRAGKMSKNGNKRTRRLLMEQSQGDLNFANDINQIFFKFISSILINIISF